MVMKSNSNQKAFHKEVLLTYILYPPLD